MRVSFQKWHGCKNDFIVIFSSPNQTDLLSSLERQASSLCARDGSAISADGLLVLEFEESSSFVFAPKSVVIINQDGSRAANCGNGLRCVALACYKRALDLGREDDIPDSFELVVGENQFLCQFIESSPCENKLPAVSVSMGIPILNENNSWHVEAQTAVDSLKQKFSPSFALETIFTCHLSNQHIVMITDTLDQDFLTQVASSLQTSYSWDGMNVHLARMVPESQVDQWEMPAYCRKAASYYEILHWERGCGLTAACGSGASSLGASIFSEGFHSKEDSLGVKMPGGMVSVSQRGGGSTVNLLGSASFVYEGYLFV